MLKKRLKSYYKNKKLAQSRVNNDKGHQYEHVLGNIALLFISATYSMGGDTEHAYIAIVVIDFEATCEGTNPQNYRHEIIEFPVVVVNCRSQTVVSI